MLEEILSEKFPNFVRLPPRDPRSSTNFKHKKHKKKEPRKVIIKLPKISDKEKNLKILKIEKMYTRETKIRLTDFLLVLMQVRRQWKNIFKMLKKKKKILSFSNIANTHKLKKFIMSRSVQQIMLKEFL